MEMLRLSLQSLMIFVAMIALIQDFGQWMRVARVVAYSALVSSILSFYFGKTVQGRVSLEAGTLGDPNEFALILMLSVPFWWLVARNSKRRGITAGVVLLCMIPVMWAFLRAGSRSGGLVLLALGATVFFRVSLARKLQVVVAGAALPIFVFTLLPSYLQQRYVTFFSADIDVADHQTLASARR